MNAPMSVAQVRQTPVSHTQPQQHAVVKAGFFDLDGFELLQRVAKAFASSTLVPAQYQGNVANCMIALNLARRLNADELMVMQNLYIVHGNPGWSAKFLIACVNTCGRYESLRYEWKGAPGSDEFGCRAWTIEKSTGHRLDGVWVDWKMVKAEGWNSKSGSKWKTMPDQMFIYRSAAFWQRGYAPEISMGLSSVEELVDVVNVGMDGVVSVSTESLRADMPRVDADGVITHEPSPTIQTQTMAKASPQPEMAQQVPDNLPQQESGGQQTDAQAQTGNPAFDADAFAARMENCTSQDTLDLMADEVSGLDRDGVISEDMAQTLLGIYRRRRDEIQGGARSASPAPAPAPASTQATTSRRRANSSTGQASLE